MPRFMVRFGALTWDFLFVFLGSCLVAGRLDLGFDLGLFGSTSDQLV